MKFTVAENGILNTYDLNVGDHIYKIVTNTIKTDCIYNLGNKNICGRDCVNCRPGKFFNYTIKDVKIKEIKLNKESYGQFVVVNGFSWQCLPTNPPHIIGTRFPEKNGSTNNSIALTKNLAIESLNNKILEETARIRRIR